MYIFIYIFIYIHLDSFRFIHIAAFRCLSFLFPSHDWIYDVFGKIWKELNTCKTMWAWREIQLPEIQKLILPCNLAGMRHVFWIVLYRWYGYGPKLFTALTLLRNHPKLVILPMNNGLTCQPIQRNRSCHWKSSYIIIQNMVENEQQQPMVEEASNELFNLDMFTPP